MIHYGELVMQAGSALSVKTVRRMQARLSMVASSKLHPAVAGMGLELDGKDVATAAQLLLLFGKTDEELAVLVRGSKLAGRMKDKSDKECADYVRGRALKELQALQKEV